METCLLLLKGHACRGFGRDTADTARTQRGHSEGTAMARRTDGERSKGKLIVRELTTCDFDAVLGRKRLVSFPRRRQQSCGHHWFWSNCGPAPIKFLWH